MDTKQIVNSFINSDAYNSKMKLDMQIQNFMDELKLPQDVIEVISKSNALLEAYGVAPGLEVGSLAPDFELPNAMGRSIRLSSLLHKGPVILSFFRGEWCAFCNLELIAYQAIFDKIGENGASIVAISPQAQEHGLSLIKNLPLSFHILSDIHQEAIIDYGLQFTIPDMMQEMMLNVMNIDLTKHTANGTWEMTVPATYIIDQEGLIQGSYVSMDYSNRMDPDDAVRIVSEINRKKIAA